jgi:uncharacterized protein (DUF885 family)
MRNPLIFTAILFACCVAGAAFAEDDSRAPMDELVRRYDADRSGVERFYDLPWSPLRFDRLESLSSEWLGKLAIQDFEHFDQQQKIDYILLRNELRYQMVRVTRDRKMLHAMDGLLPARDAIQDLERARWRMEPVDSQAAATRIAEIPELVHKLRERLEHGRKEKEKEGDKGDALKVEPLLARRASNAVGGLKRTLNNWFAFYDGYQPDFSWWMKKPYEDADKALEEYEKYLREEIAGIKGKDEDPLLGEPLGAEGLAEDLSAEFLPYTPDELLAIGEREFSWCEARMLEVSRAMGFGENWKEALAKVKSLHEPPGKQDEFIAGQAHDAIEFVRAHDLVTIPRLCEETWRLSMIPPDRQKFIPYAAYGGQNMMVAYPRMDMKHEDKLMSMRGNNMHFTRIVTAHELIPGHHLQMFYAARYRPYRGMFSTPFFVEGWALYWEMKLWDLNFARGPEDKIGMLFWRMHRAARIIVTLKFHLGRMKPDEMVNFLVDRVGHERFGATSEVRRFIAGDYSPLYQCGYMLGALQLRALNRDVVGSGAMTEKQFNDTVLRYGPIPVELIRAGFKDVPLERETKASWRFGDVPLD